MSIEKDSPTWRALKAKLELELEAARMRLEQSASIEVTEFHRGTILAFRAMLAMADDKPTIEASAALY